MKIIPKLAEGGIAAPFYTVLSFEHTASGTTTSSSKSKKSSDDDGDDLDKLKQSWMKLIVLTLSGANLHSNEMALLTHLVQSLFRTVNTLDWNDIGSRYAGIINTLNTYKNNKTEDDAALKFASDNGATNDYAIYKDKLVVTTPDGQIDFVDPSDLLENGPMDYTPITVGELANLRDKSMSKANNQVIKEIIRDSMSYSLFNKYVKEGLTSLGSEKVSKNGIFPFGSDNQKAAIEALSMLQSLSPEKRISLINGVITGTVTEESQVNQIKALMDYLVTTLPDNAKTWALVKTGNPNADEATRQLLTLYLGSMGKSSKEVKMDYDDFLSRNTTSANAEIKAATDATKEKEDKRKTTAADMFLRGLGDHSNFVIRLGGNTAYGVSSTSMPLTDATGHPLGLGNTLQDVSRGLYSGILDFSNMTIAGTKISPNMMNLIVLSDGKVNSIDFPSTTTGNGVVPNITQKTVKAKSAADKELARMGIDTTNPESIAQNYQKVNEIYGKYELHPNYNSSGMPQSWTRFAVIGGYIDERTFGNQEFDESLLRTIEDDYEADSIVANILGNIKDYKTSRKDWWGAADLYEGLIWIPIKKNYHASLTGEDVTISQSNEIEIAANQSRLQQSFQQGSRH